MSVFERHDRVLSFMTIADERLRAFVEAMRHEEQRLWPEPLVRLSFVRDLKVYWEAEKDGSLAGKEVFLLRNLSRGKGIGFFEERGFYPDFILWVLDKASKSQRIIFVEPFRGAWSSISPCKATQMTGHFLLLRPVARRPAN